MIGYVDSSVILRLVLAQPERIKSFDSFKTLATSELLRIECCRVLDRMRLMEQLSDEQLASARQTLDDLYAQLTILRINHSVIAKACGGFSTIIGTLDALHLSSALLFGEQLGHNPIMLTHDKQLRTAAKACGLEIFNLAVM